MIDIRNTMTSDAVPLKSALLEIWHDTYGSIIGSERVEKLTAGWHTLEKLAQEAKDHQICSLVACEGKKIVGHAMMYERDPGELHLARLYLSHELHGCGIGKRMLSAALSAFPTASKVRLEVYELNIRAFQFYSAQGFQVVEKLRDAFSEEEVYEFVMKKELSSNEQ